MALLTRHVSCSGRTSEKYSWSLATTKRKDCHSCRYKQDSSNSTADHIIWQTDFPTSWFVFENSSPAGITHQDSTIGSFKVQQIIRSSTSSVSHWNTNCLHPSSCTESTSQTSSPHSPSIKYRETICEPTCKTS